MKTLLLHALAWLVQHTSAQQSISQQLSSIQSLCPSISFTGCSYLLNQDNICNALPATATSQLITCYCTQDVFDSFTDCESEIRECGRTDDEDSYYEALKTAWLSACSPYLSFTATTPILSTYTPYPGQLYCNSVNSACARWEISTKSCDTNYPTPAQSTSCACQASILSLASACQIGGALCVGTPVTSSTLWSNIVCSAITAPITDFSPLAVSSTSVASSTSAVVTSTGGSSFSETTPPNTPPPPTTTTATATANSPVSATHTISSAIKGKLVLSAFTVIGISLSLAYYFT
ncbi:uncharacterized protein PV07_10392 [Cladophialophora immunda]|uniref:Extracellular membrane protein CFEM domain-containing protein n=1 Tax=Cladophialophora immunda TaxID=569365 RepID=A0A0D1ZAF9_9EURO|nr:uncharacterized protein PV07_10392 [Cladophialophora immunda]KIW24691.1 hypothetical protein PV07_10392 [Cladophialophora immunda]